MNTTSNTETEKTYGIKEVCEITGLSMVYVRRSIQMGNLNTVRVTINDKGGYKHVITETELNRWRGSVRQHSKRHDGKNRWVLYGTPDEVEAIRKFLEDSKTDAIVERNRKPKPEAE